MSPLLGDWEAGDRECVAGGPGDSLVGRRDAGRPASPTRTAAVPARTARGRDATGATRSSTVHAAQSASVTRPETLATTFGSSPSGRMASAQARSDPSRIGGLARWSTTNRTSGQAPGPCRRRPAARGPGRGGRRRGRRRPTAAIPRRTSARREPVGVRLVVDLVADPHEPVAARTARRPAIASPIAGSREVHPADDAGDERRGRGRREEGLASRPGSSGSGRGRSRRSRPPRASGARSSGPNGRRIAASSSVSHG